MEKKDTQVYAQLIFNKVTKKKQFKKETIIFSKNGVGIIGYPLAK